jgi:hypothetical protein
MLFPALFMKSYEKVDCFLTAAVDQNHEEEGPF